MFAVLLALLRPAIEPSDDVRIQEREPFVVIEALEVAEGASAVVWTDGDAVVVWLDEAP